MARTTAKRAATRRAPNTPKQSAAQQLADKRLFHSFDGSIIRVTHPDGSVAEVGADPRELPKKLWRLAIKHGCQTNTSIRPVDLPGLSVADDAFSRKGRIRDIIIAALESDDTDQRYVDAFTAQDRPSLSWVEKECGFGISADELNAVWDEIQRDIPDGSDEDAGDENGDDGDGAGDDDQNTGGE